MRARSGFLFLLPRSYIYVLRTLVYVYWYRKIEKHGWLERTGREKSFGYTGTVDIKAYGEWQWCSMDWHGLILLPFPSDPWISIPEHLSINRAVSPPTLLYPPPYLAFSRAYFLQIVLKIREASITGIRDVFYSRFVPGNRIKELQIEIHFSKRRLWYRENEV